MSFGLASLWAASHPLPNLEHNPGALGVGMFAAPLAVLLASWRLEGATALRVYLAANLVAFAFAFVVCVYSGMVPVLAAHLDRIEKEMSKGCTSPFAPIWIAEMVRRKG